MHESLNSSIDQGENGIGNAIVLRCVTIYYTIQWRHNFRFAFTMVTVKLLLRDSGGSGFMYWVPA